MTDTFAELRAKLFETPPTWADHSVLTVAFGDSVTQGFAATPRVLGEQTYHALVRQRLAERFPERAFSTVNAGVGGDTTQGALARLQRDVLDHHPDLVTVCFGLNDCDWGEEGLERFGENLARIVREIGRTGAPVIVMTPNMMATYCVSKDDPDRSESAPRRMKQQTSGLVGRYVDAVRDVAEASGAPLADVYAEWVRRHEAGEDMTLRLANRSNHPDAEGHRIFADVLFATLMTALEG